MEINIEKYPGYTVINVAGSLSNDELFFFRETVENLIKNSDADLIFNLEKVSFICSSALSLLFIFMNEIKSRNRKFIVCSLREEIQKLFVITGVDRHISLFCSVEESAASLL